METVKQVALVLCGTAVLAGGAGILLPEGTFKKPVGYDIGLVIMLSLAGVISKTDISFSVNAQTADSSEYVRGMSESQAEYLIMSLLEENKITAQKVVCTMDISQDGSIVISKAEVYTDAPEQTVRKLLQDGLGVQEVQVSNE